MKKLKTMFKNNKFVLNHKMAIEEKNKVMGKIYQNLLKFDMDLGYYISYRPILRKL